MFPNIAAKNESHSALNVVKQFINIKQINLSSGCGALGSLRLDYEEINQNSSNGKNDENQS